MVAGKFNDKCVERHTAVIYDRGGRERVRQLVDLGTVDWNRTLDGKSSAQITITGRACRAQSALLKTIQPRRHELVLFRGRDRVWEGPIVQSKTTSSVATIDANDIIEYLDHTSLTKQWPNSEDGGQPLMTERLREIITYELTTAYLADFGDGAVSVSRWENQDPPANLLPYLDIRTGTTLTSSTTEAFEMMLGEHLYNLGRSIGVNYTALGRKLLIWDGNLGQTRIVTEKDFSGDFEVIASGSDYDTLVHVVAGALSDDGELPVGHARTSDPVTLQPDSYYGPWERIVTTESEDPEAAVDPADLRTQARRVVSGLYPVPMILNTATGSSLIPSEGLSINQLIPGTTIPVRASNNIREVKQNQLLSKINVKETSEGEIISATFDSAGVVASV